MADSSSYNIVVLGGMNPRIHHPQWYHYVNLVDADELAEAVDSPNTFCTPPLAQLAFGRIRIICQEGRWEVQSTSEEDLDRLKSISGAVFDERLPHTPVQGFGFNFVFRRLTQCEDVAKAIARQLGNAQLGLNTVDALSAEFTYRRHIGDHTANYTVKPANEKSAVLVANNYDYRIRIEGNAQWTEFSLRDRIDDTFMSDFADANAQMQQIVDALNGIHPAN